MVVSSHNSKRKHMSRGKMLGMADIAEAYVRWKISGPLLETLYSVVQNWNCNLPQIQFFSSVSLPIVDPTFSIYDYSKVVEATFNTYFILLILSNLPFGLFDGHWLWILKSLSSLFSQCHKLPIHSLPGQPYCGSPQWASLQANSLPLSNLVYMNCFLCSLVKLNIFTAYILVIVCQPDIGRVILDERTLIEKMPHQIGLWANHDVEGPAHCRWSHPGLVVPSTTRSRLCSQSRPVSCAPYGLCFSPSLPSSGSGKKSWWFKLLVAMVFTAAIGSPKTDRSMHFWKNCAKTLDL